MSPFFQIAVSAFAVLLLGLCIYQQRAIDRLKKQLRDAKPAPSLEQRRAESGWDISP